MVLKKKKEKKKVQVIKEKDFKESRKEIEDYERMMEENKLMKTQIAIYQDLEDLKDKRVFRQRFLNQLQNLNQNLSGIGKALLEMNESQDEEETDEEDIDDEEDEEENKEKWR